MVKSHIARKTQLQAREMKRKIGILLTHDWDDRTFFLLSFTSERVALVIESQASVITI